jgi:hypothetical protein
MAAAAAIEVVAAIVMVLFVGQLIVVLWVTGSLALVLESRSPITYLNGPFRKSKSIITI